MKTNMVPAMEKHDAVRSMVSSAFICEASAMVEEYVGTQEPKELNILRSRNPEAERKLETEVPKNVLIFRDR